MWGLSVICLQSEHMFHDIYYNVHNLIFVLVFAVLLSGHVFFYNNLFAQIYDSYLGLPCQCIIHHLVLVFLSLYNSTLLL